MKYTEEQIKKRYDELPEDIKTAISSADTTDTVIDIGDKYNLNVEQLGGLVDETGLVMLGFTRSGEFVDSLKKRLNISRDLAESLTKEINEQILLKIRESIRKLGEPEEDKSIETPRQNIGQGPEEFISEEEWLNPLNQSREIGEIQNIEQIEDLKKEKVLEEIENPTKTELNLPVQEGGASVIEKKLTGTVKAPIVEKTTDPYREPIE